MPGAIHEIAIEKIMRHFPGAKTAGFFKALRAAFPEDAEEFRLDKWHVRPDAYVIDHDKQIITAIEVEARHPVDDAKMANYAGLWWLIDDLEWTFCLVTADKWGNQTALIDMGDYAHDLVVHEARASGKKADPETAAWADAMVAACAW